MARALRCHLMIASPSLLQNVMRAATLTKRAYFYRLVAGWRSARRSRRSRGDRRERLYPRSRRENSNACHYARTSSSRVSRCTTCGRLTCQTRETGSRSTSFCAQRASESTRPRRLCEDCWAYVFSSDAYSDGTVQDPQHRPRRRSLIGSPMPIEHDRSCRRAFARDRVGCFGWSIGSRTKNSSN